MKITRVVQIPTTVIETANLKEGELYCITNNTDDAYLVSGLEKFDEFSLKFDNGMYITAQDLEDGTFNVSPVETYLDRWVAIYEGKGSVTSSFFVAYDAEDALDVAVELARTSPDIINTSPILLLSLANFMDRFGYMPHGATQKLPRKTVKGYGINVSE